MTRSILSNWFGLLVLAASNLLLTPLMIHHLGAVDYGVWVLAGSVLDYYGLLDLGIRSAMFRYVALYRGGDQREEVDRTFSSALFLACATAALICFLSVGVALVVPHFMALKAVSANAFATLLLLLGISVAIMFPTRMLATYISAHQRWDLYNAAGIAAMITRAVAIVVVLKLGYGILAIAIVTVVVSVLSVGQHVVFLRIADPPACLKVHLISGKRIRELFAFSMRSLLISVGDYLRFYSDSAVIAAVLNVGLVTPFNVATRLIECFKSVVIAGGGPVLGTMTELDGGNHKKELQELLLRSTRLLGLLSILGGGLLLVDGRALLRIWVGQDLVSAYFIVAVLALGYTINLMPHPTLLIVIAKGAHGSLGWWSIGEGIANIGLSVVWGRSHGLLGVAMGTVVPMLVIKLIIQPWYALRSCEITVWQFVSRGLARPLLVGLLFAVSTAAITAGSAATLLLFVITVAAHTGMFCVAAWFYGLTRMERHWASEYIQNIIATTCTPPRIRLLRYFPLTRATDALRQCGGGEMRNRVTSRVRPENCGHSKTAKVSVIIPTKNRTEDLNGTLDGLLHQTRRPDEIVIVDQSSNPSPELIKFPIPIVYVFAPEVSGAAVARNVAMDRANGDIWLFLDDDVILEPQYVEEILAAYSSEIAGVSGIITNYSVPPLSRRLFEALFVRGPFHDDRQRVYWYAEQLRFKGPQRVRQFGCGVMSFRADVIRSLRFDPALTGGSLAEDIDFCARLPQGSKLVIAPNARLFHKRSETGRVMAHWLDQHAQSSSYMRARNWNRGLRDDFSFGWLQLGYAVMATIGGLKRVSLEPIQAWKTGAARGHSLGTRRPNTSAPLYAGNA